MALPKLGHRGLTPCPYCFVGLDFRQVAFRCAGRPAAGQRACVPYDDAVRARVLNDRRQQLPPVLLRLSDGRHVIDDFGQPELARGRFGGQIPCDRCGGVTAIAICPNCHSVLHEDLKDGALSVGVVGARNSGKTVWLTLVEQQLTTSIASRFRASVDHPGGTVGLAQELSAYAREMNGDQRTLPNQTAAVQYGKRAPAVYRWKWVDGPGKIISIYDTAGEDVANRDNAMQQQHLAASNAMVLVLDPFAFPENREVARQRGIDPGPDTLQADVLDGLVTVLRQAEQARGARPKSKIATPLAVVVTKMDAFRDQLEDHPPLRDHGQETAGWDEEASLAVHEHLKAWMHERYAGQLLNRIESEFSCYRLFAVSSLGGEPSYADGRLNNPPSPTRVVDPVLWVLHVKGFVPDASQTNGR